MSSEVLFTRDNGVATIRINRPDKKNALNAAMYGLLADAVDAAESDDAVRSILLCAAGDNFTAGNDLADFAARPEGGASPAQRFLYAIAEAKKPLVAAVDGFAVGVGLTLLLHCDLVYASRRAKLRAPFVDLGLVPEAGSSLLLPRIVGHARAAQAFLLCEWITAEQALDWGIVNQVVDPQELESLAQGVCARLAQKAPSALRRTKQLLRDTSGTTRERMDHEFKLFAEHLGSAESRAAIAAFFDKPKK